ncbi:MAG: 30S ribosomal protein S4 [Cyanobacteria bacterium]|nr:30S ribosomal protein S4 [Cyanobacteriota bacterium]
MARYTGSIVKQSRNEGSYLGGEPKKAFLKRPYGSGQHGQARKKLSEFAIQLREKQKVKRTYGLLEKQFRHNFEVSVTKKGVTGTLMLQRLESRLDNIVFRSGLTATRRQARQIVAHGHLLVDGKKVDVASYLMKPGQVVTVRERSKPFLKSLQEGRSPIVPDWLSTDFENLAVQVKVLPERDEIDRTFNEQLIIEFYSR